MCYFSDVLTIHHDLEPITIYTWLPKLIASARAYWSEPKCLSVYKCVVDKARNIAEQDDWIGKKGKSVKELQRNEG